MSRRRYLRDDAPMPQTHRIVREILRKHHTEEARIEAAAREGIAEDELRAIIREMLGF